VADLLRRIPEAGAVVTDASYDVIAWNPLAEALVGNLADEPNLARRRFLEPSLGRSSGGEEFSQQVVFMTADPGTPSARALRHLLRRVDSAAGQVA
jgi:hypothetical protein